MRSSAKFALWPLSAVPITCLVAALPVVETASATAVASLHETSEYTVVKFHAVCLECHQIGSHTSVPLELRVHKVRIACDGTGISLNGDDLYHTWDGNSGSGSGTIPSLSGNPDGGISASWESVCMISESDAGELVSQLLTVRLKQVGAEDLGENVGFAVSLMEASQPTIHGLSNPPWELIPDWYLENWRKLADTDCLDSQPTPVSTSNEKSQPQPEESLEALWNRLQDLRASADALNQQIAKEEAQLRRILESCSSNSTKWEDCSTLGCKVKATLSKVPELFRQAKFQVGSSPSAFPVGFCSQCPNHNQCAQYASTVENTTTSHDQFNNSVTPSPPLNPYSYDSFEDSAMADLDLSTEYEMAHLFTVGVFAALIGSILVLVFIICHDSMHCRRRRADLAARREERQARRAYRSAARRLRWRQWWDGFLTSPNTHHRQQQLNDLPRMEHPTQSQPAQSESNFSEPSHHPGSVIQAEIRGFRQALEYVGELVRNPTHDLEAAYARARDGDREIAELLNTRRSKTPPVPTAPSSTAGLSTAMSPRTSSLMSLDSPSVLTLDTLETADTMGPPPSYHP